MIDIMKRFWDKVRKGPDCWEWTGSKRNGYGLFKIHNRIVSAHRWIWEYRWGTIPEGKIICHRCDNPSCVRLSHLFIGTKADNAHDRDRKGRQVAPRGVAHGRSKLTAALVLQIRRRYNAGEDCKSIARDMPATHSSVWRAATRRSWEHVD